MVLSCRCFFAGLVAAFLSPLISASTISNFDGSLMMEFPVSCRLFLHSLSCIPVALLRIGVDQVECLDIQYIPLGHWEASVQASVIDCSKRQALQGFFLNNFSNSMSPTDPSKCRNSSHIQCRVMVVGTICNNEIPLVWSLCKATKVATKRTIASLNGGAVSFQSVLIE